ARRIGDEAHQRQRRHALAAARFAHDRQRLAGGNLEVDVIDRLDDALPRVEPRAEVLDLEKCAHERCPQDRWRGSRISRNASPKRLVPKTVRLMATPGKITSQGAVRTYSAADSDNMRPHEGYGSGMPRPRNDSDASTRMAEPSWAVASTISGARVLGST